MKVYSKKEYILTLCFGLLGYGALGHDVPVHRAITMSAIQAELRASPAYAGFLDTVSADCSLSFATNATFLGSALEDAPEKGVPLDAGGKRSINHFYDPLDTKYGKGLSDIPSDIRLLIATNSFLWGSASNCFGLNVIEGVTSNQWSWKNARGYEWIGLTSTNKIDRFAGLTNMFRAVGQVMHLLEDTTQPQHVRNEQHLEGTIWESPIEDYGRDQYIKNPQWFVMPPNAIIGWANWQAVGFTKLEDFWDRHKYNGSAAALTAAENGGDQLGLAEWCNGNFLGDRHSYAGFFAPGEIEYYPHPALADTTFNVNPYNNPGIIIAPDTLDNGKTGNRAYVSKTGAGVPIEFHSALTYFAIKHPPRLNLPGMRIGVTIRDNNVLANYHDLLIPKAVEYSAGLIDYYFRGDISAQITDYDISNMQYTVSVQNTSVQQDFGGGTFYFYQDTNGVRTFAASTNLIQLLPANILPAGGSVSMKVPGPLPTNGQFLCVYQGNIGVDGSGNALDPVDTNIAIAATMFNDRSIIFDMTYDNTNAEADFYLTDPCSVTHYEPDRINITSTCCKTDGGDNEDDAQAHQHMVVSGMVDGDYVLWVNYEGDDTNAVNCTLVTSSVSAGILSTNKFTLNTPGSGADGQYWPTNVSGPATVDINGVSTTSNATWYVRKTITMVGGKPISY